MGGSGSYLAWKMLQVPCDISVTRLWCGGCRQGPPRVSRAAVQNLGSGGSGQWSCPQCSLPSPLPLGPHGICCAIRTSIVSDRGGTLSCPPSSGPSSPHALSQCLPRGSGSSTRVLSVCPVQVQGRPCLQVIRGHHHPPAAEDRGLEVEGGKGFFKCLDLEVVGASL